ncbi:MAG: T9SS type A sorting domain-containing protein, partial [Bacteroidota bacterium]
NSFVGTSTGIIKFENTNDFIIYPIPSSGNITVKLEKLSGWVQLNIIDVTSKIVYSENIPATNLVQINLSSLSGGIYFAELKSKIGISRKMFSIKK